MEEYKPNSHKYRERMASEQAEAEKKEKVTSGKVTTKKQPVTRRLAGDFFTGDLAKIKDYLVYDIGIPALKKLISESVYSCIDMMLYGEARRHDNHNSSGGSGRRVPYNSMYDDRSTVRGRIATRSGYEYEEIQFTSRIDAEKVLDEMFAEIDRYGMVSVASMYDFAGVDSNRYTDNKFGWTNLRTSDVGRYSDGMYYLKLPKAQALD